MAEKEFKQPHSETLADGHTQAVHVIANEVAGGTSQVALVSSNDRLDSIIDLLTELLDEQKMTNILLEGINQ